MRAPGDEVPMSSWYEKEEQGAEPAFEATRWLWAAVGAVVALTLAGIYFFSNNDAVVSQVQVRHILVPFGGADPAERQRALELAQTLRERVLAGESFEALARQYSGDPGSASRGGYLGWSKKGAYTDSFEEYVWNAELGAISDLIPTIYGFHIIEVLDRRIAPADAYDMEVDRRAWEQHRREEAERSGQVAPEPEAAADPAAESAPAGE